MPRTNGRHRLGSTTGRAVNHVEREPDGVAKSDKVDLLMRMNNAARSSNGSVVQVSASYGDSHKRVLVANTDGVLAEDTVVRCLARVNVVADGDTGMQTGYQSMGHTIGAGSFD